MPLSFLQPISIEHDYQPQQIGGSISIHRLYSGLPDLSNVQIAIIGLEHYAGELNSFRSQWHSLYIGNWQIRIADLGNLIISNEDSDTYFAIKEIVATLGKKQICTIFVGGNQHFVYGMYRGFDALEQQVNMVSIDARFDFGLGNELFSDRSYMSRILSDEPTNLAEFTNIGYQSYLVAQEELDLLDKMYFEAHRLGNVANDLSLAEPSLRDADLVSLDMSCVQARDLDIEQGYVNGFSNREICSLARYAGISGNTQVFSISELPNSHLANQLIAQIVWYFCEGFNFRIPELPNTDNPNYIKYIVPIDDFEIVFYKSNLTQRWWLKPSEGTNIKGNHFPLGLIPCNPSEYDEALQGEIPARWWKAHQKIG